MEELSFYRLSDCFTPFNMTVAQRGSGGPIPRNIQGQAEGGFEQIDLVEDVPAHWRGVGLDDL